MKDNKNSSISRGRKESTSPGSTDTREHRAPDDFPEQPDFEAARSWIRHGSDERHYSRLAILDLLIRSHHLSGRIEEEFAGQPFLPDKAPDAPENLKRFKTYMGYHYQAGELLRLAVELAMIIDHVPAKRNDSEAKKMPEGEDISP